MPCRFLGTRPCSTGDAPIRGHVTVRVSNRAQALPCHGVPPWWRTFFPPQQEGPVPGRIRKVLCCGNGAGPRAPSLQGHYPQVIFAGQPSHYCLLTNNVFEAAIEIREARRGSYCNELSGFGAKHGERHRSENASCCTRN